MFEFYIFCVSFFACRKILEKKNVTVFSTSKIKKVIVDQSFEKNVDFSKFCLRNENFSTTNDYFLIIRNGYSIF